MIAIVHASKTRKFSVRTAGARQTPVYVLTSSGADASSSAELKPSKSERVDRGVDLKLSPSSRISPTPCCRLCSISITFIMLGELP